MKKLLAALLVAFATEAHATSLSLTQAGPGYVSGVATPTAVSENCSGTAFNSTATIACNLGSNIGAGQTIVVTTGVSSGLSVTGVSDGTNTYSQLTTGGGSAAVAIWYVLNPVAVSSGTTVTVTWNGSGTNVNKSIHVFNFNGKASSADNTGNANGVSNAPSCATAGSAAIGDIAVGINWGSARSSDTLTQPSGFLGSVIGGISTAEVIDGYQVVGSAGTKTYAAGGFGVVVWACAVGTFVP